MKTQHFAFHVFLLRRAPQAGLCTIQWVSCTVYMTYKHLFSTKFLLKIGPMVLFTHLNIILLQCFQFSVISKRTLSFFKFHFSPNFAFVHFSSLIFKFIQLRIFHQLLLYVVVNFSIL